MLRRIRHRRAGVTLIELLVVLAIIAVLMSLITAAAMRARQVKPRVETTARLTAINNAVGTFKASDSFGQVKYIPPGGYDAVNKTWGPFRLRNSYPATAAPGEPDQYSFEAQYLQQVFGKGHGLNLNDLGYRDDAGQPVLRADLDANQTLTFFLGGIPESNGSEAAFTGFSMSPQQPFIRRSKSAPDERRRGPILDIGAGKYNLAGGFARLTDGWNDGQPLLYFAAFDGRDNAYYGNGGYNPVAPGVRPYSRNGQFENPKGFQLISAGKDTRFGAGGNWNVSDPDGQDDQANFSGSVLGAGPD